MGLFTFLVLLAISAFSLYISYFNWTVVTLHLSNNLSIEVPIAILILSSILLGVIIILIADGYRRFIAYIKNLIKEFKKRSDERAEELYNRGNSIYLSGNRNEAVDILTKLLSKTPNHVHTLNLLGKIKREEGKIGEAIKYHAKGMRIDPNNVEILYNLFEDFIADERLGEALGIIKKMTSLNPRNPKPFEKMRGIYIKKREWDKAIDVQRQLISLQKKTPNHQKEINELLILKYKRGLDLIDKGEDRKVISCLQEILKDNPKFVPAYIDIGNAYLAGERIKDAVKIWETGYKTTKEFIILKHLIDLYQLSGDDEATFDAYRWGISVNPDSPHLHLLLGELYIRKERGEEGLAELAKAREKLPSHTSLHLLMSIGYKMIGKEGESQKAGHLAFKAGAKELTRHKCSNCGHEESEWVSECPSCGYYNTLRAYPV
ncbi:MAG: hypothetical protein KKC21_01875 [Nitrospinae bacterium]|nr:hypothetical protein [Nitrospinota bacterium]